jgi:hypothetical protein
MMGLQDLAQMGVFKELFDELRDDLVKSWAQTDLFDVSMREQHYQDLQAVNRLESKIQAILDDGKLRRE